MNSKTRKSRSIKNNEFSISSTNSTESTNLSYEMTLQSEFFPGPTNRIQQMPVFYDPVIIPPFWLYFFRIDDLESLKNILIDLIVTNKSNTIINYLIPSEHLNIPNPYYIIHIHTVLILIGIFSYKFKNDYTFLIKGGKAIQLALHSTGQIYESNDIDLLIIKHRHNEHPSAEIMAKEFAKLIVWLTSIYTSNRISMLSILEIQDIENIVKISMEEYTPGRKRPRYIPLMDIGYKESYDMPSHILPFFKEKYNRKQLFKISNIFPGLTPNIKCVFISENIDGLIYERLYFLVKIFIGKLNELSDPTIIFKNVMFLEKIYKSLLVLINPNSSIILCSSTTPVTNNPQNIQITTTGFVC